MSERAVARRGGTQPRQRPLITDAHEPASAEMNSRIRRYTLTMAFRTACFISMVFVDGWLRWVLFAGAVVLPYVAVIVANQANRRGQSELLTPVSPEDHPALTTGRNDIVEYEGSQYGSTEYGDTRSGGSHYGSTEYGDTEYDGRQYGDTEYDGRQYGADEQRDR